VNGTGSRRAIIWGAVFVAVGGAAVLAGLIHVSQLNRTPQVAPSPGLFDDPRKTFDSPFVNIRPDVAYVGDAACIECHKDISASYAHHPMGRSMGLAAVDHPASSVKSEFEKFGFVYRVEYRDAKMIHREERLDAAGKVVAATECEARYAVGSGTRGKSYLIERDGRLFQSPISWFSEKGIWDLSPGYSEELHFNRRIQPRCLACHCNQADPVEGTLNGYREPVFRGLSIGCERCHGPGERHVKLREASEKVGKIDYSIVNPRHLSLELREAVCQQCHLQGEERVLPRGRGAFDFRPGMPLEMFWSVFVRRPEMMTSYRSVGQVEQMHLSRCYNASGKLDCTSCHDPHGRPEPAKRVEFYRSRCLNCHEKKGCSVPLAERTKQDPGDSCIACHMSKDGSTNIPHTAVTDHRILRRPDPAKPRETRALMPGEYPVVLFEPRGEKASTDRDTGLVLAELAESQAGAGQVIGRMALPLLDAATKARPDDVAAWEAKGVVQRHAGLLPEALASFEQALELQANRERAAFEAAEVAERLDRLDAAAKYWRKATEINPATPTYHLGLARVLAQSRNWTPALRECDEVLRLAPVNFDARMLRITCLVRTGERERAKAEFDTLLSMRPKNEADLRRAYISLTN
jgi:predicted CXXCH cytochrome family protein